MAKPLDSHETPLLFGPFSTGVHFAGFVPGLSTHIFFIQLHDAIQLRKKFRAMIHYFADCMTNFPHAFLGDSNEFCQVYR